MKNFSKWGSFCSFILGSHRYRKIHNFRKYSVFIAQLSHWWYRGINLQWTKSDKHRNLKPIPCNSAGKQVWAAALFSTIVLTVVVALSHKWVNKLASVYHLKTYCSLFCFRKGFITFNPSNLLIVQNYSKARCLPPHWTQPSRHYLVFPVIRS